MCIRDSFWSQLDAYRIIKVASRLRIDGDKRYVTEILAIDQVGFGDKLWHRGRFGLDRRRELFLDFFAGQDFFDLGLGIVGRTEHREQASAHRLTFTLRVFGDLGDYRLPDRAARRLTFEKHPSLDARIVGPEHRLVSDDFDGAGESGSASLDDGKDATLGATEALPYLERDFVTVHGHASVARRHKHVVSTIVTLHETKAARMNQDSSIHRIGR